MKQILVPAALLLSLTGVAQKVSNKLNFQKGQKLEMVAKVNTVISMEMMGQTMDTKMDATITRMFDVENVANGAATIEHKVKRIQMHFEAPMAGSQSFDSENEKDLKSDAGKNMEKAIKNKYTMTVDAAGKITAVKADDDNPNNATAVKEDDMMANIMSQLSMGIELPKVGDTSEFLILPRAEMTKGETWTDSSNNSKTVYTLSEITDTDIVVTYTQEASTQRTQEAMGQEITMNSKDKTTGRITLDKKTGLLKERTADTISTGKMEMMGQSVPLSTKTTKTVTVKPS